MRQESSKTTLFAFLFGITFLIGGTLLLSSFTKVPTTIPEVPTDIFIKVDGYHPPSDDTKPKAELPKEKKTAVKTPEDNHNYQVAQKEQAIVTVTTTTENPTPNGPPYPNGTGTGTATTITNTDGGSDIPKMEPNKINTPKELDTQPNFPGGMKNFYQYVGNNFDKNNLEEGETIRVKVSFVIEKNGTMTDIEVQEKTNETIDNEAVRVLKSLKTKWSPGIKDGQPVRTRYTLPITVVL